MQLMQNFFLLNSQPHTANNFLSQDVF